VSTHRAKLAVWPRGRSSSEAVRCLAWDGFGTGRTFPGGHAQCDLGAGSQVPSVFRHDRSGASQPALSTLAVHVLSPEDRH
jgi:hypothetical protein